MKNLEKMQNDFEPYIQIVKKWFTDNKEAFLKSKAFIISGFVFVFFILCLFVPSQMYKKRMQNLKLSVESKDKILEEKNVRIDEIQKRIDTVNKFLNNISLKEVMEENKELTQKIDEYTNEVMFLKNKNEKLTTAFNEIKLEDEGRESVFEDKINELEEKQKKQYVDFEKLLKEKEEEIKKYKSSYFIIEKNSNKYVNE